MSFFLIVSLLFAGLIHVRAGSGTCPMVKLVQNFKLKEFAGKWYEIQRYPSVFEPETKCVTADYTLNQNGTLDVLDYSLYESIDEPLKLKGRFTPDQDNPANLTLKYDRSTWNYLVLDTDYKSYSLIYCCKDTWDDHARIEYAWILSRTPYLTSKIVSKLTKKLQSYDSSIENFKLTDQTKCDYK